tara:strand:- start:1646 stop:1867 length:222 start_codon:yes stop_codon:yes gene_type:complete
MTNKDEQTLLEIKRMVEDVRDQMQELRQAISFTSNADTNVRLSQQYEHPWDKHIREQPISGGDYPDSQQICDI